jgi:hypothetical protein
VERAHISPNENRHVAELSKASRGKRANERKHLAQLMKLDGVSNVGVLRKLGDLLATEVDPHHFDRF